MSFLSTHYLLIKALHLISVVCWMAGLLYLPRLFVYHAGVDPLSESASIFKGMERRLLKFITTPAMISAYFFGILLLLTPGVVDFSRMWFHVKLFCVVLLSGFHGFLARQVRVFAQNKNIYSPRFYRLINEIPTLLMIIIIIIAVTKP